MKGIGQLIGFLLFVLPRVLWSLLWDDSDDCPACKGSGRR